MVVTGLGAVTPLGSNVEYSWSELIKGKSAAKPIDTFESSDLPCQVYCPIPLGNGSDGTLDLSSWADSKDLRRYDPFIIYAHIASKQALLDANWHPKTVSEQNRTGVILGSGIGGIGGIYTTSVELYTKGPKRISPFFIPGRIINLASGYVSIQNGLKGPVHSVVTACSSGTHAIGDAATLIRMGKADVMLAGGTESPLNRLSIAGFSACKALSTAFNQAPKRASRPFDRDRDGFVMGEGAGVLVLESYQHAKARGARIYAEILGYGLSGDGYHITSPPEDGDGAFRAMQQAIEDADIPLQSIAYINAHGTSTPVGDAVEIKAVERLFGDHCDALMMSSTKSSTGHLLGAAGAVEAVFSVLTIRDQIVPPTINLDHPYPQTRIDLVPHTPKKGWIDCVLSNSFGFGGTNASLVIRRFSEDRDN